MADKIKAITAYRPRIIKTGTMKVNDVSNLIAGRTSLTEGAVLHALKELFYVLNFFLAKGFSINLPGLGIFTPTMSLDGKVNVSTRVDRTLISELNKAAGGFEGNVINSDMIGKTSAELIALWNEENPDDLVTA